jgi:hypothetical protein
MLCLAVGLVGGVSYIWCRERFLLYWNRLAKSRKWSVVSAGIILYLVVAFIANRHNANEGADDAMACFSALFMLLLWGLYRLMLRFLDALGEEFSKHVRRGKASFPQLVIPRGYASAQ